MEEVPKLYSGIYQHHAGYWVELRGHAHETDNDRPNRRPVVLSPLDVASRPATVGLIILDVENFQASYEFVGSVWDGNKGMGEYRSFDTPRLPAEVPALSAAIYGHYKRDDQDYRHPYLALGYGYDPGEDPSDDRFVVVYVAASLDGAQPGPRLAIRSWRDFHAFVCDDPICGLYSVQQGYLVYRDCDRLGPSCCGDCQQPLVLRFSPDGD